MSSLLVEGGRIVTEREVVRANILIRDGRIESITRKRGEADEVLDASGKFVLPGFVDAHAHLYDPMYPNREDFASGTTAAACGGVTTVLDMVLQTPVDRPDRVQEKIDQCTKTSLVDFSLHAGMMNEANLSNISSIVSLGVRSFKTFMCKPYYVPEHTLQRVMQETARNHAITNVHAEDEELSEKRARELLEAGRVDPLAHAEWKVNEVEERAISKAIQLAKATRSRLHISHMSTEQGVGLVSEAKRKGVKVSAETCPHYLTFTRKDMKKQGPYLKMNPPLKGLGDIAALWTGLRTGVVELITSEHAPGEYSEKEVGWSDIWQAWGGIPSIETMLPVLLSEGVNKKRISLQTLVRVTASNPASIFGLAPGKGSIRKGADADLVIVDLREKRRVKADKLHYKVGWTPYENWILKGWPTHTLARGHVVYSDGHVYGKAGLGRFLPMIPEDEAARPGRPG